MLTPLRMAASTVKHAGAAAVLAGAVFALDLALPLRGAVGLLYAVPVLLSIRAPRPVATVAIAAGASALLALGSFRASAAGDVLTLADRLLGLGLVWGTALLILSHRRARAVRTLLDQLPSILWVADPQLRITELHGAGGSALLDSFPSFPDDRGGELVAAHRRALGGETGGAELQVGDRSFQASVAPLRAPDGAVAGCVSLAVDVTERRLAERALEETAQRLTARLTELEREFRQTALLGEMGVLLQSCQTPEEAYAVVASFARQVFQREPGALGVINPAKTFVEVVAQWHEPVSTKLVFLREDCWALRRAATHFAAAGASSPVCGHLTTTASTGLLCVPVMAQGEALGVLMVESGPAGESAEPAGGTLPAATRRLAAAMAHHVAQALSNLAWRELLRMQCVRDPLTGLFNRRYLMEALDIELIRARRGRYPVAVIMLDLDHFKRINDTFGHQAGDAALRDVADRLKACCREGDLVCRFGGEEFVLILPGASLADAEPRAEALREAVKRVGLGAGGRGGEPVSASLGVSVFPEHGGAAEAIIRAADTALYRAKRAGRDRVVRAEAPPDEPTSFFPDPPSSRP